MPADSDDSPIGTGTPWVKKQHKFSLPNIESYTDIYTITIYSGDN